MSVERPRSLPSLLLCPQPHRSPLHSKSERSSVSPTGKSGGGVSVAGFARRLLLATKQKLTERTDSRQQQADLCWRAKSSATQALPLLLQELSQAVEGGQLPVNILPLKTEQESVREEEGSEERRREEESHRLLLQNPC